ncbi:flagellar hook-length control protein FliK [Allorhizobium taibaishanense]|uniref:Flagellar hook-length control protein FliK n=1 Tax=Allorhizobium taibaishanense TaxID=887144 RepID=A0A1Q9ABH6_9HYPH|nr:flagellar hook-length control protein FliK [Allorhizobium taibaishanense]MBB4010214.1 flagellar hook-length control protein FliK [Allorhizobium taibaishanense]OLP52211.1 hypothetical protein BJF91_02965 [Allorhizobium taibaishanense]
MIDATTNAAASPAYSSSRSDQGKGSGKDFLTALADTADRGQGQAADDKSVDQDTPQEQAPSTSSTNSQIRTAGSSTVASSSASADDDGTLEEEMVSTATEEPVAKSAIDAKTAAALIAKALASAASTAGSAQTATEQAASGQDGAVANGQSADVTDVLAKLVAALTQQDAATTTEDPVSQNTGKIAAKKTDNQLLAVLAALKQAAGGDAASETTDAQADIPGQTVAGDATQTKPVTKQAKPTADDTKDAATAQSAAAGVQDVLNLLGNPTAGQLQQMAQQVVKAASAASTDTAAASITDSKALTGPTGHDALQTTKPSKTGMDLVATDVSKAVKPGQAASTDAAGQAAHGLKDSSAADALHLVTSGERAVDGADDATGQQVATADPLQNVSVLDSRRIIAPASTSNGANIAAAMAGDSSWAQAMHSHAADRLSSSEQASTDRTMNTLKLKMTPESLGNVTATLKLTNGELTVSLVVENSAAYRKLNEDQSGMVSALKSQGFSVDQIQISIASTEKSNNDSAQTNSQSQNGNQQGMQQGSGNSGQGGNRSQPNVAFDLYGQTSTGTVDDAARTAPVGTGSNASGASGQLYL